MLESPICCGGSVSGAIVPSMSISGKEQAKTSDGLCTIEPTIVAGMELCHCSCVMFYVIQNSWKIVSIH